MEVLRLSTSAGEVEALLLLAADLSTGVPMPLVIYGRQDQLIPWQQGQRLAASSATDYE
jgi:hypothetical protein